MERRMAAKSAGILMYKHNGGDEILVLLVHPGGPYWRNKDAGAWSIPKGECDEGENAEAAARREFAEELGVTPVGPLSSLGCIRQRGGKQVVAFAVPGQFDVDRLLSNTFEMEWPPRSGRKQSFPEVDRASWFSLAEAREKINAGQCAFIDRLEELCAK
jgi:predicted NUDIX family NTP pyrophosphohydrolase